MLGKLVSRLLGKSLGISMPNILQKWESFPRPLSPKHPLKIDNIGPLIALTMAAIRTHPLA